MTGSRSSLKIGSFAWGRAQIAAHAALSREDIARLLERNSIEPWPDDLLKPVINALRGERRRGRKQIAGTARWDFLIHDAFELYQASREEAFVRKIVADAFKCEQKAFRKFLRLAKDAGELKDLRPPFNPMVYFKPTINDLITSEEPWPPVSSP